MDQEFDPYLELLGIPKEEQPPNCYRLLGIPEYTSNKQVIVNGAARQMQFLRRVGGDQYMDDVQNILNEISKVRILLLDDVKRGEYNKNLKSKEREKSGKPPGADSESVSASRSQSQFDLSAPVQKEFGRVAAIQLLFLSGPRVGEVVSLQSRDVTIGPSSRFDVMLPTRNESEFKLEHEIDQWVLKSESTSFAINDRLVNGLTTIRDGDILRFTADGPDLQFIEEVDLTRHLETLDQYDNVVASHSDISFPTATPTRTSTPTPTRLSGSHPSHVGATRRMSTPARGAISAAPRTTATKRTAATKRPAATAQRNKPHQTKLVKKPDSQKNPGFAGTMMKVANRALGREQKFSKKTGMAFDWQIGVFWLAVGCALAGVAALIIYAVFK